MKRFRKIIDDPNTHTKELAVAIKGFGFFAKVSAKWALSQFKDAASFSEIVCTLMLLQGFIQGKGNPL